MHRRYEPMGNNMTSHPSQTGGHRGGNNNSSQTGGHRGVPSQVRGQNGQEMQEAPHPSQAGGHERPHPLRAQGHGGQCKGDFNIHKKPDAKNPHPVTKFIPQSIYNPQTGKVLGFLSAEDLLILGLIFLLLDSGDECEDNSMLIYALLYILLSGHIDLPF